MLHRKYPAQKGCSVLPKYLLYFMDINFQCSLSVSRSCEKPSFEILDIVFNISAVSLDLIFCFSKTGLAIRHTIRKPVIVYQGQSIQAASSYYNYQDVSIIFFQLSADNIQFRDHLSLQIMEDRRRLKNSRLQVYQPVSF